VYVSECNDTYVEMGAPEAILVSYGNELSIVPVRFAVESLRGGGC
jgi:hypothetical protein